MLTIHDRQAALPCHTKTIADGHRQSGIRRPCSASRAATASADAFAGLPEGLTRWRLAAALRTAARPLGLSNAMLRLVELYIDLTYDVDWTSGNEPVICRPLVEIAERLGRTERQVRNIERSLVEKGLLVWRDSGNHHRRGRRDHRTGRLIYAYGPSLAPLGDQCTTILHLADKERETIAKIRRTRLAIAALRRQLKAQLLELTDSTGTIPQAALIAAKRPSRAGTPLTLLEKEREDLRQLLADLSPKRDKTPNLACQPEILHHTIPDTSNKKSINGRHTETAHQRHTIDMPNHTRHRCAQHLQVHQAYAGAGELIRGQLSGNTSPTWSDLIDSAERCSTWIGIRHTTWTVACHSMGRITATLALILIERRSSTEGNDNNSQIKNPDHYLYSLIRRHSSGQLNLDAMIKTLLTPSRDKLKNKLDYTPIT